MAKPECTNILPLIPLLADDALSAAESDRLTKHLSVCPACSREFDLYCTMKQTTATLSSPSLSLDFHENLMKAIQAEAKAAPKRARVLRPSFLRHAMGFTAAAAVLALSVVTLSQVSFFGTPGTSQSDNLDEFVTRSQVTPQVTQSQGAQPQVTQSQMTQPQGTQPRVTKPQAAQSPTDTPAQVTASREVAQPQVTQPQVTEPQVTEPQAAQSQGTTPAASCGIVAEEPQKIFATYRVFIKTAYLTEAQALLADCSLDEHGYRAENGAAPLLDALSALPGYRTECIENGTEQPLTADYILLIGE